MIFFTKWQCLDGRFNLCSFLFLMFSSKHGSNLGTFAPRLGICCTTTNAVTANNSNSDVKTATIDTKNNSKQTTQHKNQNAKTVANNLVPFYCIAQIESAMFVDKIDRMLKQHLTFIKRTSRPLKTRFLSMPAPVFSQISCVHLPNWRRTATTLGTWFLF